jgi:hypothetical protein
MLDPAGRERRLDRSLRFFRDSPEALEYEATPLPNARQPFRSGEVRLAGEHDEKLGRAVGFERAYNRPVGFAPQHGRRIRRGPDDPGRNRQDKTDR